MNKSDLIDAVAASTSTTKAHAKEVVEAVLGAISDGLAQDGEVAFTGFGALRVVRRAARKGNNPATGKKIDIPAASTVKFSPGKALKDAVNK